ncbi:MAG TPA: exonuclease, partial [Euryarchaeota archaeon]|nr:exonuclease [Euryarchaeota archaeon]
TWRLYDTLAEDAVFLDIETTGTRRTSPITVVGVYGQNGYDAAIRGKDLDGERISSMLEDTSMVITFNGGSFDLPMIEHQFPGSLPRIPHLDLRWLARRCGLTGGLKSIEVKMGISRPDDVKGMSGEDAVRLWRLFERRSNRNALKLLLKYNREDIVNLRPLTEMLVEESRRRLFE